VGFAIGVRDRQLPLTACALLVAAPISAPEMVAMSFVPVSVIVRFCAAAPALSVTVTGWSGLAWRWPGADGRTEDQSQLPSALSVCFHRLRQTEFLAVALADIGSNHMAVQGRAVFADVFGFALAARGRRSYRDDVDRM
jgi:hypothetical protein